MIRYAIESGSGFIVKKHSKYLSVIATKPFVLSEDTIDTGVYMWVDGGTVLLVDNKFGFGPQYIFSKSKLMLNVERKNILDVLANTTVAILVPLASAYFENLEAEQIRVEWFQVEHLNVI